MVVTQETVVTEPAPSRRRRRRARWVALIVVVAVVVAGSITASKLISKYKDAEPLSCSCGLVWGQPDVNHEVYQTAGPWSAEQVPARPGHDQSFYVELSNGSAVPQTILGYAYPEADFTTVAVALPTGAEQTDEGNPFSMRFTNSATTIEPGRSRWIRVTFRISRPGSAEGTTQDWTEIDVRVRVGWFTRTETIDFGNFAFAIKY